MARHRKLVVEELLTKPSAVAPVLFLGLGGCGCRMVARVAQHLHRRPDWEDKYKSLIKFGLIDTNVNDLETYRELADETFLLSDFEKEKYANLASGKLFLEADDYFTQWVPQSYRFRAGDTAGAGQIRIESRLGIFYQMKHRDFIPRLRRLLEDLKSHEHGHRRLDSPEIRIVLCYSVAGGTGSGCHLPLAYVVRDLARELGKPRLIGVAVLPAVFEDKTGINKDGTFANGYAALKETEHLMKLGSPDSLFYPEGGLDFHYNPADESKVRVRQKPFEFVYVVDKPQSFTVEEPVDAAADGLYLQFFSPLYGRQASDYDNYTQHQRFLVPHDFEAKGILGFSTFYGSYGGAVLLVPVPGLVDYCSQATALSLMQESFLRGIPGEPTYQSLRINRQPFDEVTLGGGKNEKPIHRADFHKKEPRDRERLQDRLFAKRVRLLASCEARDEVDGRYLNLFRHGHRLGERPTPDGDFDFRKEQVKDDQRRLADGGMEYSINALVLDAVAGSGQRGRPGLLREAEKAIEELASRDPIAVREGRATVGDYVNQARILVDEFFARGLGILKNGYKRGTVSFPGFDSLIDLDFLREEAGAVDLAAKRYAVINIREQVEWEQKEPEILPDFDLQRDEGDKVKKGDAQSFIKLITKKAKQRATDRLKREFLRRLGDLKKSLDSYAAIQRTLDEGFEDLERESQRRLERLRREGDPSANQYVLDAEALQVEDGRRMWDFYYHDKIAGRLPELTLKDKRVQQVLSDTVTDLSVAGGTSTPTGVLDKLNTSLRKYARGVLEPHIGGDPHSADRQRRDGLTLSEALELEVTYRALHKNHASEVEKEGVKAVRRILAEYRALPQEKKIDLKNSLHQDYLRDKIKRVVKEKASLLCVYDDSRDQHGGVRPDHVFLAAIDEDFKDSTIGEALRGADIANLEWVTEGWHNPKEIIFYRSVLNVPLYVFGRMDDMRHHYHRFKQLAKRSKVLHIDKNWEEELPDLDPQSSQEKHRQKLVGEQIVSFAALLTTRLETQGSCVLRREGKYFLADPSLRAGEGEGNGAEASDHEVLLGESLTHAIEHLPDVLEGEKVKYMPYQQMLQAVQEGLAPEVLRRVVQLPFQWRRSRDELRQQYGSSPEPHQKTRLKDFTDSFNRLQESLHQLLERLRQRQIEQRTLGEEALSPLSDLPTDGDGEPIELEENLSQSIRILDAFSKTWQRMENPAQAWDIPRTFLDLFRPLPKQTLEEVLESLRTGFGLGDGEPLGPAGDGRGNGHGAPPEVVAAEQAEKKSAGKSQGKSSGSS